MVSGFIVERSTFLIGYGFKHISISVSCGSVMNLLAINNNEYALISRVLRIGPGMSQIRGIKLAYGGCLLVLLN